MVRGLLLLPCFLAAALAFNKDQNYHGYGGTCPHGWHETDPICYRSNDDEVDFRNALDECTERQEMSHDIFHEGHIVQPALHHNLMPVGLLTTLMRHGRNAHVRLGTGPYRVNAIKSGHDNVWREYDGGDPREMDVYHWHGGRVIDFSMFPEFDPAWGEPGDTLVWYPHSNKLYARPHYHKYKPLCYRRKQDAERCPGVPDCNYHGDCFHGKCYCHDGWVGDDCCCKPKLLVVGGAGPDSDALVTAELFDFENRTSCIHSYVPGPSFGGEATFMNGLAHFCGFDLGTNDSYCFYWDTHNQTWAHPDYSPLYYYRMNYDSVQLGDEYATCHNRYWWHLTGIEGDYQEYPGTEEIYLDTWSHRFGYWTPYWNQDFCAVKISEEEVAMIGGVGNKSMEYEVQTIYLWDATKDYWADDNYMDIQDLEMLGHECELLIDPDCGRRVVNMFGSMDSSVDHVIMWDTEIGIFREGHDLPTNTGNMFYEELVKLNTDTVALIGGYDGNQEMRQIYTYSMANGFDKVGDLVMSRVAPMAVMVWGDEYKCLGEYESKPSGWGM